MLGIEKGHRWEYSKEEGRSPIKSPVSEWTPLTNLASELINGLGLKVLIVLKFNSS